VIVSRFSRNEALFGAQGQALIEKAHVGICGLGGLGSHVAQQLAYLGVRHFLLIDFDIVTTSSLNRLIGAIEADIEARTPKIEVGERTIKSVRSDAEVSKFSGRVADEGVTDFLSKADVVFGCLDSDVHRLELLGAMASGGMPYFDLATDIIGEGGERVYGGRVILNQGEGCLVCLPEVLNQRAIAGERLNPSQREAHRRIYGIEADALAGTGPSVVSLNGVVASLAVTECMALLTGLRTPFTQLTYRGQQGVVAKSRDLGEPDCLYCTAFRASR
jgi:molybdopterin/thiamine biosynthesis adenylyltransferase